MTDLGGSDELRDEPSIERVADLYSWAYAWRSQDGDDDTDLSALRKRNRAEFDRALEAEVVRRVAEAKAEAEVEIDRVKTWGQRGWGQHRAQWLKREGLVSLMESWCDMGVLDRINGEYELSSAVELAVGAASEEQDNAE